MLQELSDLWDYLFMYLCDNRLRNEQGLIMAETENSTLVKNRTLQAK